MKNISLKTLPFCILVVILLTTGCLQNSTMPDSSYHVTETSVWRSARDAVQMTVTQSVILTAQSWTSTATPLLFPTDTFTPTPTLATPPIPTATFPAITPMTPLPLQGIRLSGKVVYDSLGGPVIDLSNYHFDAPLQATKTYYPNPFLYQGTWSRDDKYFAQPLYLPPLNGDGRYTDLAVCILDEQDANNNQVKCIRIYTGFINPRSITQGNYAEIKNVTWSPDNKYLLVVVKGFDVTSPCLVELRTGSVDCHWAEMFYNRAPTYSSAISEYDYAGIVVGGAHAISWSPRDENKLAIPLKINWLSLSEGIQNGHIPPSTAPWYPPTYDLRQGLYLVNITPSLVYAYPPADDRILTLLWEAPQNTTVDPDQMPAWTSDGKQIAFVYVDPWFNVARNPIYPYIPTANYAVGMIGEDGKNFQKLFDSRSMYLSGVLPSDSSIPAINIHRWVYQNRFLLFTAQIYRTIEAKYQQSLFLYDMKTNQFFQLTNWNDIN